MKRRRRIGAYGVCHDRSGRVLLVRASAGSARPGTWFLPGGGVEHGEDPADAVVREVREETGLAVEIVRVRDVAAELVVRPPYLEHTDGVIYDLRVTSGMLRPELNGTTDAPQWVAPLELARLPLSAFAAHTLGQAPPEPPELPEPPEPPTAEPAPAGRSRRGQRFAAYGVVTDPSDRVLLTLNADGYPSAGRWHLPGGGTDFGEQPVDGLLREITEESGQVGRVGALLAVTHHHNPAASGPEGYPMDWHGVRAVFGVSVAEPTPARVLATGGSTAGAAWFTRTELPALPLTELAVDQLGVRV